jgi:hypothetical protein
MKKSLLAIIIAAFAVGAYAADPKKPVPKIDCTKASNKNKGPCLKAPESNIKPQIKKPEKQRAAPASVKKKADANNAK